MWHSAYGIPPLVVVSFMVGAIPMLGHEQNVSSLFFLFLFSSLPPLYSAEDVILMTNQYMIIWTDHALLFGLFRSGQELRKLKVVSMA